MSARDYSVLVMHYMAKEPNKIFHLIYYYLELKYKQNESKYKISLHYYKTAKLLK